MHVIATAGHVDHGKSTLIRALTGMEPDRWAEERRRGMTIDLGYAWTTLPNGQQVAFVDVPGHSRFISNALAGVGPVPAVLLVVAADEGWSRQTSEHVQALDALGVRSGVLALTRADLGDAELAEAEARDYLAGTGLAGIEAVAVSAVTGFNLDRLRAALGRLADSLPAPPALPTRLWIDRCFTVRGAGTVVTGTLPSGELRADDELEVVPGGGRVRVRGLQTLKEPVEEVHAVARVAVNLRGGQVADLPRGTALVSPGQWAVTSMLDVRVIPSHSPAGQQAVRRDDKLPEQALFYLGSASIPVRVRPLGADLARLKLSRAVPVRIGERAIIRDPGRFASIFGVDVLDPYPPQLAGRGAGRRRHDELRRLLDDPGPGNQLRVRGTILRADLERAGGLGSGSPLPPGIRQAGAWLVDGELWERWKGRLLTVVDEAAAENPLRPGVSRTAVARLLELPDPALVELLVRDQPLLVSDADGVHRRDHGAQLPAPASAALAEVVRDLTEQPFAAPEVPDLEATGLTEPLLQLAARQGTLLRLTQGVYLLPDDVERAVQRLRELPQPFTVSAARHALGTTRRVAVPLLEELDRRRLTRRLDENLRELAD